MGESNSRRKNGANRTETASATPAPSHCSGNLGATDSAAYLAAIVESADDAIVSKTLDGIVTSWNASAQRMFGFTAQEMIGQPILRLIPPNRRNEEELILSRLRAGERIEHFETVRVRKNGQPLEVSLTISPVRDATGAIIGASKIARDITERRNLETAVRMSEQQLRLALDAAAMGTFIWHVADDRGEPDAQMLALFGQPSNGTLTLAQALATMIHPEDKNRYAEAVARATDPGGDGELREDIRIILPDGSQRWVAIVGQVYFEGKPRRPTYMAGAATNITDRKDAEEALQNAHDKLDQRVRERTRDLASANRSLRRLSRQVLEVQETERRRIARELHDEIGQALTGVKMMLETASLTRAAATDGSSDSVSPLLEELALIEDTLNRVRDLSLDLRPAMLDSLGLLPTLLWRFETYSRQTGIQVEFHHTGLEERFAAEVETGAYRIVQEALTNVVRHAAVPLVRVHLAATDEALRIYVIDEGVGFESDEAIAAGLSTGLAGMRERATLLGGVFLLSSAPGAGTTIEVELPSPRREGAERGRDDERDLERDAARDAAHDAGHPQTVSGKE